MTNYQYDTHMATEVHMAKEAIQLDCIIFGGGVAGLFTLDKCLSKGLRCVLLESQSLGTGQTIGSQGIIHGGVKYALTGGDTSSAIAIREMPLLWRRCLAGESTPDLSTVSIRSDFCYIWRTDSLKSKLGWLAAKFALRTKPRVLDQDELPEALHGISSAVARLDEQVIEPRSLLEVFTHSLDHHLLQTVEGGVEITRANDGWKVQLLNPETGEPLTLVAKKLILTAGSGNQNLRGVLGLQSNRTQERPLHMVMARGKLPVMNGHCIEGSKTRVTITTTEDYAGRTVWQIGGQLAEQGVELSSEELIRKAIHELREVFPNVCFEGIEFRTYMASRAEVNTHGTRPVDISILEEENVLTCWPTKLAFAPRLAEEIASRIEPAPYSEAFDPSTFASWPTPTVALPPWESDLPWSSIEMECKQ
jgi:glycerol-3-phosphate dehydrogenase